MRIGPIGLRIEISATHVGGQDRCRAVILDTLQDIRRSGLVTGLRLGRDKTALPRTSRPAKSASPPQSYIDDLKIELFSASIRAAV